MDAKLTITQAAELLNVCESFVLKQLDAGELTSHVTGMKRVLRRADVLAYRDRMDERAEAALTALTAEAEELGLYRE